MAGLNEGPKPSAWDRHLQMLHREMERTGADEVSKDGITLRRNTPAHEQLAKEAEGKKRSDAPSSAAAKDLGIGD